MDFIYYIFGFIISAILLRFVFSIDTIVINMKAQTKLLAKIAQKLGSTDEEVTKIIGKRNMPK